MTAEEIKRYAKENGADLVGIANVERWVKAPLEHSPRGILPPAKSVIVCAIHIPDACVELGGEEDLRKPGPAVAQVSAGVHLNSIAFLLSREIQKKGGSAVSIPHTGLWRYRACKGASRGWIGDICHYYAAVAAGLGEIGWHNLCMTSEYGTRQRFASVITDLQLEPDPLYNGAPLCDRCLLCAKMCPTKSFEKEVSGMAEIEIENKKYTFPKRNLWRCAVGENFQLDVFLPLPEKIDEKWIIEMEEKVVKEHPEWIYGWKMGMCFKYCVPSQRRYFEKSYCKSPRRRRDIIPQVELNNKNADCIMEDILSFARKRGVDIVGIVPGEELDGIDLKKYMPDAGSLIILAFGYPENCAVSLCSQADITTLWLARYLENKYGFSVILKSELSDETAAVACGMAEKDKNGRVSTPEFGNRQYFSHVIISARLPKTVKSIKDRQLEGKIYSPEKLTEQVRNVAKKTGADLVGIAPVERVEKILPFLEQLIEKDYFIVEDGGWFPGGGTIWGDQAMPYNPRVKKYECKVKRPQDYLKNARSIIIVGLELLNASIDSVGKPPGEKSAHYMFTHRMSLSFLSEILFRIGKVLDENGYKVCPSFDLCGLASTVYSGSYDLTASRFAAVAAGLGEIGWSGLVLTPEFGPRQRFAVLLTDAELVYDKVYKGKSLCKRCFKCVDACPVKAISRIQSFSFKMDGRVFEWGKMDTLRCDWAKKYGLVGKEGVKYLGSQTDFAPPDRITPESVCEAIRNSDRLQRPGYSAIVERCFIECPASVNL